eukprot:TRINITY_DN16103_c0_g1_i1.p1 TRINITY_DN16103_c0_g1~~TRINITY_DN16103_c0_g1_i1.p1  ORF type:complete len:123 (+),score=42.81 TRINITY_DN16103_c0_g1_i1:65-433(+)
MTARARSPLFDAVDTVLMDLGMDSSPESMMSSAPETWREDEGPLRDVLGEVLRESGVPSGLIDDDAIVEMVRFGAAELHPIAAFMGGVAAQEIIKLVTHQYTPINNTFIYNGIPSSSNTIEL